MEVELQLVLSDKIDSLTDLYLDKVHGDKYANIVN